MLNFIDHIAQYIINEHRDHLTKLKILFPNKRAALFLGKRLSDKLNETHIQPELCSIDMLIDQHCDWIIPERTTLIHQLYTVAQKFHKNEESFAHFYGWGDKLLSDYDLLDKCLVKVDDLFETINDIREIEERFAYLSEDSIHILRKFWTRITTDKSSHHWRTHWDITGKLYHAYREKLLKENLAYSGMKYRYVAHHLEVLQNWINDPVIIAGFNRLSQSEDKILSALRHGTFFWQTDAYFMHSNHMAGEFMRANVKKYGNSAPMSNFLKEHEKRITIVNLPRTHIQGQYAFEFMTKHQWKPEKTMILLPDENQLISVLTNVPESITSLNISMGWATSESPISSLIELIIEIHLSYVTEYEAYPTLLIHTLLHDRYVSEFIPQDAVLPSYANEWTLLYEVKSISSFIDLICLPLEKNIDIFDRIIKVVELIFQKIYIEQTHEEDEVIGSGVFTLEILKHLHQKLLRLRDIFVGISQSLNLRELIYLFRLIFKSERIPFKGEPLKGMQILGPLESRSLDFDHIIVLNMKEGKWPPKIKESVIPNNLKKAFHMPVAEDEVAEFSYYFWSLLPHAQDILLLNPHIPSNVGIEEPSRFLIELELLKNNFEYRALSVSNPIVVRQPHSISIVKSEDVMKKIYNRFTTPFSASSILTYMSCTLRYYFQYIIRLEESDRYEEGFDVAKFGSVFHLLMQDLYLPYEGTVIHENTITKILGKVAQFAKQRYREEYNLPDKFLERGQHMFYIKIIKEYARNILEIDRTKTPFHLVKTEMKFTDRILEIRHPDIPQVTFTGIIDRVDIKDGNIQIIDYKTGKTKVRTTLKDDSFDSENIQSLNYNIQLGLYAHMFGDQSVQPFLYGVKDVAEMKNYDEARLIFRYKNEDTSSRGDSISLIDTELIIAHHIREALQDLLNSENNFEQTPHLDNCKYCPYTFICSREQLL